MFSRTTIIIASIATLFLVIGYILIRKNITVKFYNKTGHDVDSLIVGDTFVGHISNNDSTEFIKFRKFHFDSGIPYEDLKGQIQRQTFSEFHSSWCGTERYTKTNGSYSFDIRAKPGIDTAWIYLDNHNKNVFTAN